MPGPAGSAAVKTTWPVPRTGDCSALPVKPDPVGDTLLESSRWAQTTCISAQALFLAFVSQEVPVPDEHFTAAMRSPWASLGRFTTPLKSGAGPHTWKKATH